MKRIAETNDGGIDDTKAKTIYQCSCQTHPLPMLKQLQSLLAVVWSHDETIRLPLWMRFAPEPPAHSHRPASPFHPSPASCGRWDRHGERSRRGLCRGLQIRFRSWLA